MSEHAIYAAPTGGLLLELECESGAITSLRRIHGAAPTAPPDTLAKLAFRQLDEYFSGTRRSFELPLRLCGTPFQQRVWSALCEIPYGETRSYRDIAEAVGSPRAYRAVGMANNRNPILILVPCHRVIGADGALVGYGGGLDMKRALLELEGSAFTP